MVSLRLRGGGGGSSLSTFSTLVNVTMKCCILLLILPCNQAAFWKKVKPRITKPSGPTNVTLDVVSRTELGVAWEPPLYDGGRTISKYLVEWDIDKRFSSSIASPTNPYGNGVDGPLVRSEVVSGGETEFRIAGLEEGEKYVRIMLFVILSNDFSTSRRTYIHIMSLIPLLTVCSCVSIRGGLFKCDFI